MIVVCCNMQQIVDLTYFNFQADKVVGEMKQKSDQKVEECKEESRLHLLHIQEENAALVWNLKLVQT